jgi:chromosome condensin MukBEF complex kleisin-like MukF subunit
VIVRVMHEGQYQISDEVYEQLNEIDNRALAALEEGDEAALRARLKELAELVRSQGERLDDAHLGASDAIVPPDDLTLEEARQLFHEDGLIPDLP